MPKKGERKKTKTKNVCIIDGEYYYRYSIKDPATGDRIQKEDGPHLTEKDAENSGIIIKSEILKGTYIDKDKKTVGEFASEWLKMYQATGNKGNSKNLRKSTVNLIKKTIGGLRLQELTSFKYQEQLNKMRDVGYFKKGEKKPTPYSKSSIRTYHTVMGMIFSKALELEYIKKDITQFAQIPKFEQTVEEIESSGGELPKYLEKEQLAKLFSVSSEMDRSEPYTIQCHRILFILAYTGMRIGELLALKNTDIDEVNKVISITKTLYIKGKTEDFKLTPPKNTSSIRKIDVSQRVINVIKEQMNWKNEYKMQHRKMFLFDEGFLFFNEKWLMGYPMRDREARDYLKKVLEKSELPLNLTPHSLRHTYTSLMAEAGVELAAIQHLLGHKNDNTTKLIYLHVTNPKKRSAVEKLDMLMDGIK
ncbi:tyrosine-type recombinase/integrase [Paenibacillus apis]|uniref:Site-specific integrase n=1 Tax=Paenibacillus apis TaxID=1792174 RepID=A0A920CKH7_9BACL|nr:site-specific integrase [Paenibacillus apis]GIO42535.1 site-specific integrase [Paenibacillus apis]